MGCHIFTKTKPFLAKVLPKRRYFPNAIALDFVYILSMANVTLLWHQDKIKLSRSVEKYKICFIFEVARKDSKLFNEICQNSNIEIGLNGFGEVEFYVR